MYDKKQILKLMQQFKKKNQAENKQARSQNSYKIIFPLKTKNQNFIPSKLGKKKGKTHFNILCMMIISQ